MYNVIILPLAKEDLKEAVQWYDSKQKGLGKKFLVKVREKVKHISKNPYLVSVRYDEIRTAVLNIFPFMIHHFIEEEHHSIVITAVLHTSRSPDEWQNRS